MPRTTKTKSGKFQYRTKTGRKVGAPKKTRAAAKKVTRRKK